MLEGIDVSHYQGEVDWIRVAGQGVSFAYAKATQGASFVDWRFARNGEGARAAGFRFGAYHFLDPVIDADRQADHFLRVIGDPKDGDLPPALDVETAPGWRDVPKTVRVKRVAHFLSIVERAIGRMPVLYVSPSFWTDTMGAPAEAEGVNFAEVPLWVAHYTRRKQPRLPQPWENWTLWQYTSLGRIEGIEGHVDLDRMRVEI